MARIGFAGPVCIPLRAVRRPSTAMLTTPTARVLRAALLLLAATHGVLFLSHMPDTTTGAGAGPLLWMVASGLIAVALALLVARPEPAAPATTATQHPAVRATTSHPELLDLLARLNHDLRTPLNAVIGFSDLMQREMLGPLGNARYQEYARHIRDSGDELLKATEDALAMTTLLAATPQLGLRHVALAEILDTLRLELDRAGNPGSVTNRDDAHVEILAEPDALLQAIRHLVHAAAGHAAGRQAIRIEADVTAGRVGLTVLVGSLAIPPAGPGLRAEPGLGREALSLRLARVLLGLQGLALTHDATDTGWLARIEMPLARAGSS